MSEVIYNSDLFSFKDNVFVVEASDLRDFFYQSAGIPPTLKIVSDRTGVVKTFNYLETELDDEGEVTSWNYVCGDMKVVVFND